MDLNKYFTVNINKIKKTIHSVTHNTKQTNLLLSDVYFLAVECYNKTQDLKEWEKLYFKTLKRRIIDFIVLDNMIITQPITRFSSRSASKPIKMVQYTENEYFEDYCELKDLSNLRENNPKTEQLNIINDENLIFYAKSSTEFKEQVFKILSPKFKEIYIKNFLLIYFVLGNNKESLLKLSNLTKLPVTKIKRKNNDILVYLKKIKNFTPNFGQK